MFINIAWNDREKVTSLLGLLKEFRNVESWFWNIYISQAILITTSVRCVAKWCVSRKVCIYVVPSISFQTFFLYCRRHLTIQYVIAIHLMRCLNNIYDFRFKWTATAATGIHPTKAWLSLLVNFKNAIWTSGHFRWTICNKILFWTWKKWCHRKVWNASDCFWSILHELSISFEWVRDSRKPGSLWGMIRGVGGVRKSIHHSWLDKGLGLGLLCWGFKGVQEEIPREEASTLEIGSVAFPRGQCTSPQLYPCHRLFDQDEHQDSSSASL